MQIKHHTLLILAWLAVGQLCTGCSAEDIQAEVPEAKGVLCLSMSADEVYVEVETRASQKLTNFSGYTFTLNGDAITFTDGKAIVPAGTYTLSATNSGAVDGGYGGPLHEGSSKEFTLGAGEQKTLSLNLGSPKNAMVTVVLSKNFTNHYTLSSLTLKEGEKGHTLTPNNLEAYFPAEAETLNYTLVADANKGSHVQDITGATGTVGIAAGTHTTLTLDVNPITGYIKIESGGSYNGEFQ